MTNPATVLAPMLLVPEGAGSDAAAWYTQVLQASERWRIGDGHLVALELDGAWCFVRESTGPQGVSPSTAGLHTAAVELFVDDPDAVVDRARAMGVEGEMKDRPRPWGIHRQGGFTDPWGHGWLVGDKSPLSVGGGDE